MTWTNHHRCATRAVMIVLLVLGLLVPLGAQSLVQAATEHSLVFSTSSNRSNPTALANQVVSGTMYVFTQPDASDIRSVRFYLDNPGMAGSPRQIENSAPYDFAGGSVSTAKPFKTTSLADGIHTITAAIDHLDGSTQIVNASFTVRNVATGLTFNATTLTFAAPVDGPPASQTVEVTTVDGSMTSLTITDNVAWATISTASSTAPAQVTITTNPASLAAGTYTGTVTATASGYTTARLDIILEIPGVGPDQVHLAWVDDPATTMTVVWRTTDLVTPSTVEYRPAGTSAWRSATGTARPSGTTGILHETTLQSLVPATAYEYRVRGPNGSWSQVFETRTAPANGPADFDVVYVADTGLFGREDGLATGTRQVIAAIDNLNPLAVLGGGDYISFNRDKRFGTLDNSIDAWFNQMQPIVSDAPFMPAYGNHEALLSEKVSTWAERFPTPAGSADGRNYSFDIGDAHFVSIFVVDDNDPLPSATLDWIRQDIEAAKAAGQRWIIQYFHVSPFAEGTNHPSNLAVRQQLGPLFESLGVQLVIAAHDQSYERTYPLVNVPATNTPTSTSTTCYTMSDGVTWVKVSPGGKISDISLDFSPWERDTPSPWTASRDNTMHHFLRVRFSAAGTMRVEAFGVPDGGSPPVIQDSFEYTTGACPPPDPGDTTPPAAPTSLVATSSETGNILNWDDNVEPDLQGYIVYRAESSTGPFTSITRNPVTGSSYTDATAASGTSYYRVTAVDLSGNESPVSNTITVERPGSAFTLVVSMSSNRSNAVPLDGRVVSGTIYVFTTPNVSGITRVRFYLDDPALTGPPDQTERTAPYDFAGGTTSTASPFRTTTIANGQHTIMALVDMSNGSTQSVKATFTVANGP